MTESYHIQQPLKTCNVCHQEKPLDAFVSRPNRYPDGRQPRCKECQNKHHMGWKARTYPVTPFPKNLAQLSLFHRTCVVCGKEKLNEEFDRDEQGIHGRRTNCKECASTMRYEHRQANLEEHRARNREDSSRRYHALDEKGEAYRQMVKDARDRWAEQNPLKRNEHTLRYKARKVSATIGPVSFAVILERDGLVCCICNTPIDPLIPGNMPAGLTFDHDIPLSRDGAHSNENLHPAHMLCNSRKLRKSLAELTPWERRGLHA